MTAVATVALYVGIYGALATALVIAGKYIYARAERHEAERSAAAAFEEAYIAEAGDVVAQEAAAYNDLREALADEMVAVLDEAIGDVAALLEAAALVDELEGLQALLEDMGAHVNRVDRQAAA